MGEPLEVKDMSSMLRLVVPLRSQNHPPTHSKLAPIEMMARSIQLQGPVRQTVFKPNPPPSFAGDPPSAHPPLLPDHCITLVAPHWVTPAGYTLCGFGLALCNLIAPGYIQPCAQLLCPMWTLALALHTACTSQSSGSEVWVWGGVLTILLLPFVIMIGSPIFVGFYLLVFATFASRMFWKRLQGVPFILAWVCWLGLIISLALSVGMPQPYMHLSAATLFSISLGVLNSGGAKCVVRATWNGSPA